MIEIREASEADLPVIVALLAEDVLGSGREQPGPPLPVAYREGFRRMRRQGGTILLAVEGELVVGCLQLDLIHGVSHMGQTRSQVEGVRVAASRRGKGIGARLMEAAMARARAAGATAMQLTSNAARRDAHRFYVRLGFSPSHMGFKRSL